MAVKFLKPSFLAIPNYEILKRIDGGGICTVYRGRNQTTGEAVAIKVIKPKYAKDPTLPKRLEQEFRAASNLIHPNIVQALAFGQDKATAYLVMEFVEGESLGARIARDGPLPESEAIRIIMQVAQALHFAHGHGMIHRDVKPDNILLKANGQPKLTDFGLVKDLAENLKLTTPLSVLGTPNFMAPEQYLDPIHVDARCDIYSLGATLYLAVTGKAPFEAPTPLETLRKQANNELLPPRRLVPSLSKQIDRAICWAMSPDPLQRPTSCVAFVKDLKAKKTRQTAPSAAPISRPTPFPASPHHKSGIERRAFVRYLYDVGTSCSMVSSIHQEKPQADDRWPASVQDVSLGGLGLVLGRRFEVGATMAIDLAGAQDSPPRSLLVRVVRVAAQDAGQWLVGCVFLEPPSKEELQTLLQEPP